MATKECYLSYRQAAEMIAQRIERDHSTADAIVIAAKIYGVGIDQFRTHVDAARARIQAAT